MQAVLGRRLGPLNARRLALLDACEAHWPGNSIRCEHVMGALFVPALQMARNPVVGGPSFLRLLGRVHSDTAPFIQSYLTEHCATVFGRFFDAFSRALPDQPRDELGWRLQFALKALAGVLASDDIANLMPAFTRGRLLSDAQVLAQLTAMVMAALCVPAPGGQQLASLQSVFDLDEANDAMQRGEARARETAAANAAAKAEAGDRAEAAAAKPRQSRRAVRNEGASRAAMASVPVRARDPALTFPSNPLDDWMRMRART